MREIERRSLEHLSLDDQERLTWAATKEEVLFFGIIDILTVRLQMDFFCRCFVSKAERHPSCWAGVPQNEEGRTFFDGNSERCQKRDFVPAVRFLRRQVSEPKSLLYQFTCSECVRNTWCGADLRNFAANAFLAEINNRLQCKKLLWPTMKARLTALSDHHGHSLQAALLGRCSNLRGNPRSQNGRALASDAEQSPLVRPGCHRRRR